MTVARSRAVGIRTLAWSTGLLSIAIFIYGLVALFVLAPSTTRWDALKDFGPAIVGSWVLCAALLSITAACILVHAARRDAAENDTARDIAVTNVCVGEIKAFWDRVNELQLVEKLGEHIEWMKTTDIKAADLSPLRRALGNHWFVFFHADPVALGGLRDGLSASYISLSARSRSVIDRFNWLNTCAYDPDRLSFWQQYHTHTLEVLKALHASTRDMMDALGQEAFNPDTFRFGRA